MKCYLPAKTFLLGEYVAMQGGPAMVLTTTPCFEVGMSASKVADANPYQIHPDSSAGRFWRDAGMQEALTWFDPYDGIGGLGASSAEFLGAYLLYVSKYQKKYTDTELLKAYWDASAKANPTGVRPSGYDVLAQAQFGCVYLHQNVHQTQCYPWCFDDIGFILLHTGQKLKTHEHLQDFCLTDAVNALTPMVTQGKQAFDTSNSALLIDAVHGAAETLLSLGLVAPNTAQLLHQLKQNQGVLAAKGCGAMGADVVAVLAARKHLTGLITSFKKASLQILASTDDLYEKNSKRMR